MRPSLKREISGAKSPETLELGRLSEALGFLLRMAQIEIFETYHQELGMHGLKPGEFAVFWLIDQHPGVRQGLVATSLYIKHAHMTKLVRSLEERGYITRVIPDNDRRSVLLNVTDEGHDFLADVQDEFLGSFSEKNNRLSKKETKTLIGLLQKLTGIQEGPAQ